METALPLLGGALVLLVAVDVVRTVLVPSARRRVRGRAARAALRGARRLPGRLRRPFLRALGPLTVLADVASWLVGLWLGFALVYLPHGEDLVLSPPQAFGAPGLAEALYLSGAALTTLGFGDVVAGTTPLRLVTVLEAASGFGVLTASLGYLPTLYTLLSDLRATNQGVADLGAEDPRVAAEVLRHDGVAVLDDVRRLLLARRQHLQRFPVLHLFSPPEEESLPALARGAAGLWLAGRASASPELARHVDLLERALVRLVEDMAEHSAVPVGPPDREGARALARRTDGGAALPDAALDRLARTRAVLAAYAAGHRPEEDGRMAP